MDTHRSSAPTSLTERQQEKWQAILNEYNKEKSTWFYSTKIITLLTQHFKDNDTAEHAFNLINQYPWTRNRFSATDKAVAKTIALLCNPSLTVNDEILNHIKTLALKKRLQKLQPSTVILEKLEKLNVMALIKILDTFQPNNTQEDYWKNIRLCTPEQLEGLSTILSNGNWFTYQDFCRIVKQGQQANINAIASEIEILHDDIPASAKRILLIEHGKYASEIAEIIRGWDTRLLNFEDLKQHLRNNINSLPNTLKLLTTYWIQSNVISMNSVNPLLGSEDLHILFSMRPETREDVCFAFRELKLAKILNDENRQRIQDCPQNAKNIAYRLTSSTVEEHQHAESTLHQCWPEHFKNNLHQPALLAESINEKRWQ